MSRDRELNDEIRNHLDEATILVIAALAIVGVGAGMARSDGRPRNRASLRISSSSATP